MKLTKNLFLALAVAGAFTMASCGGSKKAATDNSMGTEVNVPCSDVEFHSDAKFFRGTGMGTSQDLSTAKRKASLDANTNLAASINRTIKSVTDRYTNERTFNDASEFEEKFEQLTRDVVNQELNNVSTVCSKTFNKDGKYNVYVAVEVAKDELLNNIKDRISKDQKLQLDYDKMKFEQIFNEEMDKIANERP
ncbi:MAG TPA: hypothetical protein PLC17_04595 [Tenuifilaceae bacterium]|nr:hypothetical protein [Tenuifilaceae bacterium]HQB77234.1 hypothetical protein [Tenuifilaceae bacterium]